MLYHSTHHVVAYHIPVPRLTPLVQVKLDDDSWKAVPPRPTEDGNHALVLNLGEMAHRWTNEGLRATPHRVINRSGKDRYSIAFFWDPQLDMITDARDLGKWCPTGLAKHPPLSYGVHLRRLLNMNYDKKYGESGSELTPPEETDESPKTQPE